MVVYRDVYAEKNDMKNRDLIALCPASKTGHKFTQYMPGKSLPEAVSVSCDGLAFMVYNLMAPPGPGEAARWVGGDIVLQPSGKGTPIFNHSWRVFLGGEPVANLHTHTKNSKIIKDGVAKLEILNHVLYSSTMIETLNEVLTGIGCTGIKNVSSLHIAVDGVNHIYEFLNLYIRQTPKRKFAELNTLGRWDREDSSRVRMKGKARFDAKVFDRKTGFCQNFKCGSGSKSLVVYDKTSELQNSHKEYIRETWERSGIDTSDKVWRCELRLSSKSIKEIKDLDIQKLNNPNYMLQILKTHLKNFFEFYLFEGDGNVSRARVIDLFQFEKLKIPLLEKIPRAVVQGAYKAKMGIHCVFGNILKGVYKTEKSIEAAFTNITDNIQIYNLDRWYEQKKPEWQQLYYSPMQTGSPGAG